MHASAHVSSPSLRRVYFSFFYIVCVPKHSTSKAAWHASHRRVISSHIWADPCVCVCEETIPPRQTGFTICPCCVLWFPCVIQTNVRLRAGDELWQTAPDILSSHSPPPDTPDKLSVTFPYSGQWEHCKLHAVFTCFHQEFIFPHAVERHSEIIYFSGQKKYIYWNQRKWIFCFQNETSSSWCTEA